MSEIVTEMAIQKAGINANGRYWDEEVLRRSIEGAKERFEDISFVGEIDTSESISGEEFADFFLMRLKESKNY